MAAPLKVWLKARLRALLNLPPKAVAGMLAGVAAAILLVVLLATAPARLLGHALPAHQVWLSDYNGTLWNGRTAHAAVALGGGWLSLGEARWRLSPWSLLLLSPRLELHSAWGGQRIRAEVTLSPTGAHRIHTLDSRFPASLVKQWLPVQLRGDITLLARDLALGADGVPQSGGGELLWRRAYWVGNSTGQALGDYRLQFAAQGRGALRVDVTTLSGPVLAAGSATLQGRGYSVDVRLDSEQGFGAEIASALQLLAAPGEDGSYHIQFSGGF